MTAETPKPPPSLRDLEEVMARSFKEAEPGPSFRSLRLQPVVMPPPPGDEPAGQTYSAPPVSEQDDIEPDHSGDVRRSAALRLAMASTLAVLAVSGGWWAWQRSTPRESAAVPEIRIAPHAVVKTAASQAIPSPALIPAPAGSSTTPPPVANAVPVNRSMGQVSTDLVPPTTDGLSPARRIATIRILVENDREVPTSR